MTPFKTIWHHFITVYPIDSFQDHMTWFLHCVPNWLLSWPFDPILSLSTHLTPFKTIWPIFCVVYPVDSFQDHLPQFYHCVPYWLLERSQLGTHCKNLVIWSGKESIWYTMIKLGQMVLKAVNWVQSDTIRSNGLESSQLGTHTKIRSYGLKGVIWFEMSDLGTQYKHQVKGLERSQLCTQ